MQRNAVKTHEIALMRARIATVALLVFSLVVAGSFPVAAQPQRAFAVTEETEAEPDDLQQRVEQSAAEYDAAVERVAKADVADDVLVNAVVEQDYEAEMIA